MEWLSYKMHSDQHLPQDKKMVKFYKTTQDNLRRQRRYYNLIWGDR